MALMSFKVFLSIFQQLKIKILVVYDNGLKTMILEGTYGYLVYANIPQYVEL